MASSRFVPPSGVRLLTLVHRLARLVAGTPSTHSRAVRAKVTMLNVSCGWSCDASTRSASWMMATRSARSIEPELSRSRTRFSGRPGWRPAAAVLMEKRSRSRLCANG
jgi:hypothetical protein